MPRPFLRPVSCLALILAGTLQAQVTLPPPGRIRSGLANAQQPLRAALALDHLLGQRDRLGLGAAEAFTLDRAFTNTQGETFVRLDHTYQGHRVWGSRAMARVSARGAVIETRTAGVMAGVALTGAPSLGADQAARIALDALGAQVKVQGAPAVEQVAFAPRYTRETFVPIDRTPQPRSFTWAYQVHVGGKGPQGPVSTTFIIDGASGVVLRQDDQLVHAAPTAPVPAMGTGLGAYSGQVALNTTRMEDGTYALWDTTRGSLPNPALLYDQQNYGWGAGTVWQPTGLQVWFEAKDADGNDQYSQYLFQKDALGTDFTDAWGDGQAWGGDWVHEGLANGQTAGVDALHAMTATWDFFGNVFNRNGVDGLGTTLCALALQGGPQDTGNYQTDVASWDSYNFALNLGAGSYPANPAGQLSMTDLDLVAHEMAHGLTEFTAAFDTYPPANVVDEPALNEGSADFLAQMVKAYASLGPADDPFSIPNTGTDWTFGRGVNRGTPLRSLARPSLDGASFDAWHDGLAYVDPHYAGGVLSRALSFLAAGASPNPADDRHSTYLPGGMAGVGNDHAARIWWKVLTENFLGHAYSTLLFKDARGAALGAAIDLFGEDSPEAVGVANAFAAVNVGAAYGQPRRTEVAFANWREDTDWFKLYWYPWFESRQIFPMGETVPLKITVTNNANTKVTWSVGGPSLFRGQTPNNGTEAGGRINVDGTWTIPNVAGKYAITATSVADPAQFAEGRALAVHFDCDSDGENDAMDLAVLGVEWGLDRYLDFNQTVWPGLGVDDSDVAYMVDCVKNAWPVK